MYEYSAHGAYFGAAPHRRDALSALLIRSSPPASLTLLLRYRAAPASQSVSRLPPPLGSRQTEQGYVGWYKRFVLWHKERAGRAIHPRDMGATEVEAFLTHLAVNRDVSSATQNQALNALVFLYREVLEMPLEGIDAMRAREKKRLPVVLAVEEVKELLEGVRGDSGLAVKLLYGCGLRVAEVLALRIKDVDVDVAGNKIEVRGGKGDKDCLSRLLRLFRPAGFASLRLSRA